MIVTQPKGMSSQSAPTKIIPTKIVYGQQGKTQVGRVSQQLMCECIMHRRKHLDKKSSLFRFSQTSPYHTPVSTYPQPSESLFLIEVCGLETKEKNPLFFKLTDESSIRALALTFPLPPFTSLIQGQI